MQAAAGAMQPLPSNCLAVGPHSVGPSRILPGLGPVRNGVMGMRVCCCRRGCAQARRVSLTQWQRHARRVKGVGPAMAPPATRHVGAAIKRVPLCAGGTMVALGGGTLCWMRRPMTVRGGTVYLAMGEMGPVVGHVWVHKEAYYCIAWHCSVLFGWQAGSVAGWGGV